MISVVIPAYNRKESVLDLLRCLSRQEGVEFEVIVVDDHSSDGTPEAVEQAFPEVVVLRSEINRGPAVARNRGIRHARGGIVVGLDSDVTVEDPRLLAKTAQFFAEMPDVAGFAFRIFRPDGVEDDVPRWWHPLPVSFAHRRFFTNYFSGTAYAFRREGVMAAGLFPEILFMHHEELELAYRVLDSGRRILYVPELSVLHHEHRVARRTEIRLFYNPRNQILMAVACFDWLRAVTFVAPRMVYSLWLAFRWGQPKTYLRMIKSAAQLAPRRLSERKPLKASTWRTFAALREGVFP